MEHVSVLSKEVEQYLDLMKGDVVLDATLGLGGHSKIILDKIGETGRLIAFDQDEKNLVEAKKRLSKYSAQTVFIHDNFRHLKTRIAELGIGKVDKILFDLGLSSPQIDEADRGFSFMKEGPLDMRFNKNNSLSAYEVVNQYSEEDLINIFYKYGEIKMSKILARGICARRKEKVFETTVDLADFISEKLILKKFYKLKFTILSQVFQAIRIEVNDELNALNEALTDSYDLLGAGGRIAIISFHSLEDRIVKQFFKELEQPKIDSIYSNYGDPKVIKITKKPVSASDEELKENSRSRSAKLRVYQKI